MPDNTMSKTMTQFWMESKISEDSRWHSMHEGDFRTPDRLADHFVGKLRDQCRIEESNVAIMPRFTRILKELLESYESQANLLIKLADTGRMAVLLHQHIDIALDTLDIMDPVEREEWHQQLLKERQERLVVFEEFVKEEEMLVAALGDKNQQLEIVTLLRYCVEKYHDGLIPFAGDKEKYRDKLMAEELDTISMVYDLVVEKASVVSEELPEWFVTSEHEWAWVNKAKLEDSKEAWDRKALDKYIDENLSVEIHGEVCEEVCVRLASIWTQLNHPHLRKFYGASYVGKAFVIHETCFSPTYEDEIWHYVSNCALGLQYVHDRGLVYYNLTSSTFLSSYSERRGVLDGVGLVPRHDSASLVIRDILRFGMSVFSMLLRARNSSLPSDKRDLTFDSWTYESTEKLPDTRPTFITEEEWEILQGLCASNATKRLGLVGAADRMALLASRDVEPAKTTGNQPSQQLIDEYKYTVNHKKSPAEMLGTISELLEEVIDNREQKINRSVFSRLQAIYWHLKSPHQPVPTTLLINFCEILHRFQNHLDRIVSGEDDSDDRHVSRTVANIKSRYHYLIDQLIRSSPFLQKSAHESCHKWLPAWEQDRGRQDTLIRTYLDNPERYLEEVSDDELSEAVAVLRFAINNRPGAFSSGILEKLRMGLQAVETRIPDQQHVSIGEPLPKWFVMNYQIMLDSYVDKGGFGSVHLGKWFGTNVVVKLLSAEHITPDVRKDFRREADLWFTLNHSNLIKLYGACYEGQQPFFVCERATRKTLVKYLEPKYGRGHETWFRLLQAALGLQHLHNNNIVHGDLKGNNILVCDGGATKIADFGLSILGTPLAKSEKLKTTGAVRWKAPECVMGERPTFASDIYAFGMCIIEAVTQQEPWRGVDDVNIVTAIKSGKMCPRVDGKFQNNEWELVTRMCRSNPRERIGIGAVIKILEDIGVRKLMPTGGMEGPTTVDRKMLT
ncbi:unnamed protein product [Phytophthora fragariaefolia]|uniref:Unnamed protein product n=1 Tax=Phytophthora fragariaefolia TaxID=1490495 RepID=A0A9W7CTL4_9STRA|nr:unnamed protein product [Phytophthora fragariaefolia]